MVMGIVGLVSQPTKNTERVKVEYGRPKRRRKIRRDISAPFGVSYVVGRNQIIRKMVVQVSFGLSSYIVATNS